MRTPHCGGMHFTLFLKLIRLRSENRTAVIFFREMRWFFLWPVALVALASSLKLGPPSAQPKLPPSSSSAQERKGKNGARSAFPSCEAAAKSCVTHFSDHTSYPNIAAGESIGPLDFYRFNDNIYIVNDLR